MGTHHIYLYKYVETYYYYFCLPTNLFPRAGIGNFCLRNFAIVCHVKTNRCVRFHVLQGTLLLNGRHMGQPWQGSYEAGP